MAISIEFKDKYVYFGPEAGLHTQGEARAEVYDVTGPRYHDGHDLSAMTWYVRASHPDYMTIINKQLRVSVDPDNEEQVIITWPVEADFTAYAGQLDVQFVAKSSTGEEIIKLQSNGLQLAASVEGTVIPPRNMFEAAVEQIEQLADDAANAAAQSKLEADRAEDSQKAAAQSAQQAQKSVQDMQQSVKDAAELVKQIEGDAESAAASASDAAENASISKDWAAGKPVTYSGAPVSIAYAGANRIASITAYGENAQGGTTEAPMALTGVDNVFVGDNNLLPKATETRTLNGVTFTPNPDGSVSVSGTATSDSYYTFAHYMERALLGQTVCLSGSSQLVTVVINERTSSATFVRNVLVDRGQGASGIVTKRKDSNVLYAVLQVQSGDTVNEVVYPMLNLGKSPLPYKPYQGSVTPLPIPRPLHKVGDVRDICCTRVKSVYDKRIVIDQNSIINMSGEASIVGTSRRFNVPAEDIPITNDAVIEPVRCNILPARPSGGVSGTYALDAPGISLQNNQSVSQPNINIRVPGCKTLEEIKAWLTDNPLTVYYQSTSYNGANGLDICLTEYQNGSIELDGTESNLQFFSEYQTLAIKGITTAGDPSQANAYGVCISSHFALVPPGTSTTLDKVVYGQPQYNQIIIHDTSWNSLETAKAYLAAQKAAGTPVQIAYQLATPEVYATDPVDFDNAAGPLTVLTGGELEAAFKSADKVVESRIDFVEDTLNEQGQAIAEKAPISHSSDKSTYGLGSGSQFGHVKLSDATASGSNAGQGIAATPSAVNQVNARVSTVDGIARAAMPKSGGTFTGNVLASSANEAGAFLRNISVQNSASQLQYTNFIIMVRK